MDYDETRDEEETVGNTGKSINSLSLAFLLQRRMLQRSLFKRISFLLQTRNAVAFLKRL